MTCQHTQFVEVEIIRKQGVAGVVVVCVTCGQIRDVYADGEVDVRQPVEKQYTWNGSPCTKEEFEDHMNR